MDFQTKIRFTHPTGVPIPFFMAYPGYLSSSSAQEEEKKWNQDMEYLRQTYPAKVRRCQRRVEEILDKMDYEGSMIYDEYPDSLGLQSLARMIAGTLKKEDEDFYRQAEEGLGSGQTESREGLGQSEEIGLEDLLQVLVCDEILRRRHKADRPSWDGQ